MDRRYFKGIASVLYFICFVTACGLLANTFEIIILSNRVKMISDAVLVISGYTASFFYCYTLDDRKANNFMKTFLFFLFGFYIIMLIDYTLIDDNFGRNIFNFLSWDKNAFSKYIKESTNIIPFATVKLFIKGYFHNSLTFWDTVLNLVGNFLVLMPVTFFTAVFFNKTRTFVKMTVVVFITSVTIELLQFLFLTGASDIDDVILNISGAMIFYRLINTKKLRKVISRMTFGVWENEEEQN